MRRLLRRYLPVHCFGQVSGSIQFSVISARDESNFFRVFFERKFDYTPEEANTVNSIIYSIAAVASPLCGYIVDKTGRNVMWVFMATVVTIGAHALLAFSFVNPYVGTIIMGMAYSMLASSLWPLVALIIPEYQLGTAYGICQSVQNLGLAVVSMFAGVIVDNGGYLMLELFFIGWLSGESFKFQSIAHVSKYRIPFQWRCSQPSSFGCMTSTTRAC